MTPFLPFVLLSHHLRRRREHPNHGDYHLHHRDLAFYFSNLQQSVQLLVKYENALPCFVIFE